MKAQALIQLDHQRDIHLSAFLNQSVQGTKKKGKKEVPLYPKFTDFFDYDKQKEAILGEIKEEKQTVKEKHIRELIKQANKKGGN
ncbi:MAG: hypothetical protein L0L07_00035 [Staphylococcus equorum]|nr:hypothetical protein [Staphylococcus equorum]